ncbi:MAG: HAD family hydrolase [Komarekiella atlantica HA4396-MV6]|jgi:phosphoglycolate phosphatase-like HAD superfamily hydrolase|nr:HAD family hydrolase [Komarekiella atlantica HA4396-MV6]
MKLVMFDIDGTLTESNNLDDESYLQALHEVFGFSEVSSDWASYTHVTDACILKEVCQSQLDRLPSPREVEVFQKRFLELLINGAEARKGVKAISGSSYMLKKLLASPDYQVAYAGGGWAASAIFKLKSAHLPIDNIPYAFSDDDESREGIMAIAHLRAETYYNQLFPDVVYIGDGVWDIRSAKKLGYSFIGIASDNEAKALFNEGAIDIFPNYDEHESFFVAIQKLT